MTANHKQKHVQAFTLAALIILGGIILFTLSSFFDAFLGAIILYIMCRPLMRRLVYGRKWNKNLAAFTVLITSFLILLIPITLVITMIIPKLTLFVSDTSMIVKTFNQIDLKIKEITGIDILSDENLQQIQQKATEYITDFLSGTFNMMIELAFMYFIVFYLLYNTGQTEKLIESLIPMEKENTKKLSQELKAQTYSNVVGAPLLALIQGLIASIGYWIFGLQEPFFWGLMTGFFSFIPFVGSALIWVPAAVYQLSVGMMWQGVAIIIFGIAVIGTVDNIVRFVLQKKFADVHPMVTVLGVIIGLPLFGVPGIIFGPLLVSYFMILFKIYREEYM